MPLNIIVLREKGSWTILRGWQHRRAHILENSLKKINVDTVEYLKRMDVTTALLGIVQDVKVLRRN